MTRAAISCDVVAGLICGTLLCVPPVRQEQELRNGSTVDKKLSTLADLFRPPIELMHKGSFETVSRVSLHHWTILFPHVDVFFLFHHSSHFFVEFIHYVPDIEGPSVLRLINL